MDQYKAILSDLTLDDESVELLIKNYSVLPDKIHKLHKAMQESLALSQFNIKEKSLAVAGITQGWLTTLFAEKAVLDRLQKRKVQLENDYANTFGDKGKPRFAVKEEAKSSVDVMQVIAAIESQELVVRYLEESLKIIRTHSYNIGNAVDIIKLEEGR